MVIYLLWSFTNCVFKDCKTWVALLVERSLLIPEFRDSNLVIGKLLNGALVKKRQ